MLLKALRLTFLASKSYCELQKSYCGQKTILSVKEKNALAPLPGCLFLLPIPGQLSDNSGHVVPNIQSAAF